MATQADQARPEKRAHVPKEGGNRSPLEAAKKWIGLVAAVLSLITGLYGALQYQADRNERIRTATGLLAGSQLEQAAGDYPAAWKSLQRAIKAIDAQGLLVHLFGGLSAQQEQVHAAQEDLGMAWLRAPTATWAVRWGVDAGPGAGHRYSEITDPVLGVLSAATEHATGTRKADLLAHIGWAFRLKQEDHISGLHPESFLREAIALDPTNPYAHAFWGYWMLTQTPTMQPSAEQIAQAQQHFAAALSSKRAVGPLRQWVRIQQLNAIEFTGWIDSQAAASIWWQAVSEMRRAGEPFDKHLQGTLDDMYTEDFKSGDPLGKFATNLDRALRYAPIEEHLALLSMLLRASSPDVHTQLMRDDRLGLQVALATALEKAGKPGEALATWRDALARLRAGAFDADHLDTLIDPAIQRLQASAAAAKG